MEVKYLILKGKNRATLVPVLALFVLNSWTAARAAELSLSQIDPKNPAHIAALRTALGTSLGHAYMEDQPSNVALYLKAAHDLEEKLYGILSQQSDNNDPVIIDDTVTRAIQAKVAENPEYYSEEQLKKINESISKLSKEGIARHVFASCNGEGEPKKDTTGFVARVAQGGRALVDPQHSGSAPLNADSKPCSEITSASPPQAFTKIQVTDPSPTSPTTPPVTQPPATKPGDEKKEDPSKITAKSDVDDNKNTKPLEDELKRRLEDLDKQRALDRLRDAEDQKRLQDQLAKGQGGNEGGGSAGGGGESAGGAGGGGESAGGSSSGGSGKGDSNRDRGRGLRDLLNKENDKRDSNLANLVNRLGNSDKESDRSGKNERNGSGSEKEAKNLFDFTSSEKSKDKKEDEDLLKKSQQPLPDTGDAAPPVATKPPIERKPISKAIENFASALGAGLSGAASAAAGGLSSLASGLSNFGNPSSGTGAGGAIGAFPVLGSAGGIGGGGGGKYTIPNVSPGFGSGPGGGGDTSIEDEGPPEGAYADSEGLEVFAARAGSGPSAYSGAYLGEIGSGSLSSPWLLNAISRSLGGGNICSLKKPPAICQNVKVQELKGFQIHGIDPDSVN
ncbi:MAG: hypothetical protein KDD51_12945 [Bdellovibrionales bacterium]|nr:hypothetical protein [Bdellovibrionales bacterium]